MIPNVFDRKNAAALWRNATARCAFAQFENYLVR